MTNISRAVESEKLARNAIEQAGFEVHSANVLFRENCKNIDLVVYGKSGALYVQVKSSTTPSSRHCITVDGSPWTQGQLDGKEAIYNKHAHFEASFVVLVDMQEAGQPKFYVVPPKVLTRHARVRGKKTANIPKKDGTRRSINFRKELPKATLKKWLGKWELLGEPVTN